MSSLCMGRRVELTWWIPRTACLVQVGVGRSCSRIPPWIACKTPQARQKILETLTSSRGAADTHNWSPPPFPNPLTYSHRHTGRGVFGLKQDVHRWRSLKNVCTNNTVGWMRLTYTNLADGTHLPIWCGRRDKFRNISNACRHVRGMHARMHHASSRAS